MSLDAMKQALDALEHETRTGNDDAYRVERDALRAAIERAQEPYVKTIKTWQQRCEDHPDHDGIVSDGMIQARMQEEIDELRAAIEQAQPDELMIWKSRALHAERMIDKFMQPEQGPVFELGFGWLDDATKYPKGTKLYTAPRQWQGLTDDEIKAPIQKAMQHFGFDPTQYSLGGMATIGFLGLVREIEAKLKEKNT